ncbi:exopolysaccharide production protein ExoZ [Pseudomonas sp. IT-P12]|uniref:acyltransferase family protein n=1 Tax=Pseudomonas sp. IT-P12 TaxID=3026450 RepID=UPI0039DFC0E7
MNVITTDDRHRLALVDALRCFAAFWVVLFHLSEGSHIPTLLATIPSWLKYAVFDAGHLGVPVFFVLSGIVMATTTSRVTMNNVNAAHFVARRLIRLAPPYYAAIALGVAVIATKRLFGQPAIEMPGVTDILAHLVFLQDILGIKNIITVFWTLCIEVQFYIAFALLLWLADQAAGSEVFKSRNHFIWASALLALLWPTEIIHSIGWKGGFIAFWYSFMAGVLCAQTLSGTAQSRFVAMAYCALILLIGVVGDDSFAMAAGLTGLAFCLLINRSVTLGFLTSYPVQKMALISYSLYLFHAPVTGTFMRIYRRFMPAGLASDALATVLIIASCIAFAAIAYVLFERPAIAWSRRIKFRRTDAAVLNQL